MARHTRAIGRGTLLIGQTSITEDRSIDVLLARRAEISDAEREHYGLQTGDILVSRVFATLDVVGQPALVPDLNEPAVYESNMMRLQVKQTILAPIFLFHWLRSVRIRKLILLSGVNLSNQASINQQALNRLPVVIPSICEQKRELDTIRATDESIQANSSKLGKFYHLKSSLMSDLLTGRVRVPESFSSTEINDKSQ